MDIIKALRDLYNEKKRLDVAISSLEARLKAVRKGSTTKPSQGRRGRKSMSEAERQEVSKRMTLYWEARRAQARPSEVSPPTPADTPSTSEGQQASTTSA
jgi:hypothetical protein